MSKNIYTIAQFYSNYPSEDACLEAIFKARYGAEVTCKDCGEIGVKFYRVSSRKCYACANCGYQIHPLANTIFHKSSTPLKSWFFAMYLFSSSKNGVAAKELERQLGVTYKTAWRIARQIRSLMKQHGKIGGKGITVEADETYMGGKHRHYMKYYAKTPVLGVVERGGEIRARTSDTASTRRTKDFLYSNMARTSTLYTDESRIYSWTKKYGIKHDVVNHRRREYVRGDVYTNTIESFWGQLKRSINGTYHHVSKKYMQLYVDEFVFRYNLRKTAAWPVLFKLACG